MRRFGYAWLLAAMASALLVGCGSSKKYSTPTTTTYTTSGTGYVTGSSENGDVGTYAETYVEAEPVEGEPQVVYEPAPSYVVVQAPPPPQTVIVVPPPAPYDGAIWVAGHWRWNGYSYVWLTGHYIAPRPGYVFVQPRWEYRRNRYVYVRGYYRPQRATVRRTAHTSRRHTTPARPTTVIRPSRSRTPTRSTVVRTPQRRTTTVTRSRPPSSTSRRTTTVRRR